MLKYFICFAVGVTTVMATTTSAPSYYQCDPTLDCMNAANPGDKVPNRKKCDSYYICVTSGSGLVPSDVTFSCPLGQCFDDSIGDCADEESSGKCSNNFCCNLPPDHSCESSCSSFNFETVGYVGDCSKYYVCTPSGPILVPCRNENLYYNGEQCVSDAAQCCDFCSSYCAEAFTEIPYPYDCTKFYLCLDAGPASEVAIIEPCGNGEHFDPEKLVCVTGSDCTNICSNSTTKTI